MEYYVMIEKDRSEYFEQNKYKRNVVQIVF